MDAQLEADWKGAAFKTKYHVRECQKCCANCRYGNCIDNESYECEHPENSVYDGDMRVVLHGWMPGGLRAYSVCDAWDSSPE